MGLKMDIKRSKANIVLSLGLVGIAAVLITIVSDLILLGRPDSGFSFFQLGTETMTEMAQWRIVAGTFLGVFVLPLQLAGLVSLYYGLKPAGKVLPLIVVITDAHALIMGVAFHVTYAYIASGWKLFHLFGPGNAGTSELMKQFDFYWKIVIVLMMTELILSSALFVVLILKGKTLYPKWMALFNPPFIVIAMLLIISAIPKPVGGYIAPTILNLSTLIFFIISTAVICKRLKNYQTVT